MLSMPRTNIRAAINRPTFDSQRFLVSSQYVFLSQNVPLPHRGLDQVMPRVRIGPPPPILTVRRLGSGSKLPDASPARVTK